MIKMIDDRLIEEVVGYIENFSESNQEKILTNTEMVIFKIQLKSIATDITIHDEKSDSKIEELDWALIKERNSEILMAYPKDNRITFKVKNPIAVRAVKKPDEHYYLASSKFLGLLVSLLALRNMEAETLSGIQKRKEGGNLLSKVLRRRDKEAERSAERIGRLYHALLAVVEEVTEQTERNPLSDKQVMDELNATKDILLGCLHNTNLPEHLIRTDPRKAL
ncbi:MAG: hypothetical protein J6N72_10420 [Psychrobacter sp.]|nr:hypothetical protein [Psychrobacter sp.]